MKTKNKTQMVLIVVTFVLSVFSQESKNSERADANEIFNSMMQTMPKEMRARVDSASNIQSWPQEKTESSEKKGPAHASKPELSKMQESDLNKLPQSVQEQVRKTMQELEQQKDQRILEFKENKAHK